MSQENINRFKSKVSQGFARPNLFEVVMAFPDALNVESDLRKNCQFLVRAAQIPSFQLGIIEVPYRGRTLKIAGDRTFEPWTVTVMNPNDFKLRNAFEDWVDYIQAPEANFQTGDGLDYYKDLRVHQLSRDERKGKSAARIRSYKFENCFPSNVSSIDLDYGNNDAIEEFTVEFQVQFSKAINEND